MIKVFLQHLMCLAGVFFFSLSTLSAQTAITKDGSPAPPHSIYFVKGSGGHVFHINDTSGYVGLGLLGSLSSLEINGSVKLVSPGQGSIGNRLTTTGIGNGLVNNRSTQALAIGNPTFSTNLNLTNNNPGNLFDDDFVFGSNSLNHDGNIDHYSRFFFDKSKAAFRVGYVDNMRWDADSLNNYSVGIGYNVKACGDASIAVGNQGVASGSRSTTFGTQNMSSSFESFSFGSQNKSSWSYSFALGFMNQGNRNHVKTFGSENNAGGDHSIALGHGNTLSHGHIVAIGSNNSGNQPNITLIGNNNFASGTSSLVVGRNNDCSGLQSVVFGDSIEMQGYQSVAMGSKLYTSGSYVSAFGNQSRATSDYSLAVGDSARAVSLYSTAIGSKTRASGYYSLALGELSEALAKSSLAIGENSRAKSAYEVVLGAHNSDYVTYNIFNWNNYDRLFTIGRGPIAAAPYDALIVRKDGKITIDGNTFNSQLKVTGYENDGTIAALEIITEGVPDTLRIDGNEIDGLNAFVLNGNTKSFIGIGTDSIAHGYRIGIGGKVAVEEVRSQVKNAWPDYVFGEEYELPSVEELVAYIDKHGHLPQIPSAREINVSGLELGEMQRLILEKIEELTLGIIEMEKKIKELESSLNQ